MHIATRGIGVAKAGWPGLLPGIPWQLARPIHLDQFLGTSGPKAVNPGIAAYHNYYSH
jgi:hypothetical protein